MEVADQQYLAGMLVGDELPVNRQMAETSAMAYRTNVSNREPDGNAPYGRLLYHSDMMWADNPMQLLSLYGLKVQQPSVPTVFVSTTHAWDTLPADLRARVDGVEALHVTGQQMRGDDQDELVTPIREHDHSTIKPVGNSHPRTGRTMLYVCQMMTREIVGLSPQDSEELLEALFAHLYDPAHALEHGWQEGDLVAWDNLAVQHARPHVTVEGPERTLRKVIAPVPVWTADRPEMPRFSRAG
jgi:taurine dioxygenase